MTNEITPEQYKAEVLKQNFARRCADYEDVIATLQTQLAVAQQQLKEYETDQPAGDAESPSDGVELPPPPAPPEE